MSRAQAQALHEQRVSRREIADRLGVSIRTVSGWLRRPPAFAQRRCRLCRQEFTPTNGRQRFCSVEHCDEYQREHRPPRTVAGWRARVEELEAELTVTRQRLRDQEPD